MALKVLIAGCPSDEKGPVEAAVKGILAARPTGEHWSVSLVRLGKQWSVTLDGPGARAVAFMATDARLREALAEALPGNASAAAPGPGSAPASPGVLAPPPVTASPRAPSAAPSAPARSQTPAASRPATRSTPALSPSVSGGGERRDPHACENCSEAFIVVYESGDDESQEVVPVACPHCWHINRVFVTLWAATGRDYRAEKG
jgi:hypothetical protein